MKDAFLFSSSSLSQGVGSFHVSGNPDAVSIPEAGQILVPPLGDAPISTVFSGPLEQQQPLGVWMRTPTITAVPFDTNRYLVNNAEMVVLSYGFQDSNSKALNGPPCAPPPEPAPQPCFGQGQATLSPSLSSSIPPNGPLVASSISSRIPQSQSRRKNTTERCEKKNWCSLCEIDFSQSQVLIRHIKDKHQTKESCFLCTSFKWSLGRPYLYRKHLQTRHPQIPLPEARQKGSRKT